MNLAFSLRPRTLSEFFGQDHLVGEGKIITRMLESGKPFSMIFWGPPGSGKTTLAKIIDLALTDSGRGLGTLKKKINAEAKELLIRLSGGDARIMLNSSE